MILDGDNSIGLDEVGIRVSSVVKKLGSQAEDDLVNIESSILAIDGEVRVFRIVENPAKVEISDAVTLHLHFL